MNSDRSNNLSLKYLQRITLTDCRDIGIRKFELVAKTQFLWTNKVMFKKEKDLKAGEKKID